MDPGNIQEQLKQLYESIEASVSEGLTEVAVARCEEALKLLEEHQEDIEDYTPADFMMLAGNAHWTGGDLEEAQRFYRRSLEVEPDRLEAMVAVGVTLFHLARFEAARAQLEVVSAEDPEIGEVWYYLALLALRRGDRQLADLFFSRAHDLEPERWLVPQPITLEDAHKLLEDFFRDMPAPLRKALENVPVVLEERPSEALLYSTDPPLDPLLLGLFEGAPLTENSPFEGVPTPTQITIFAENVSLIAADRAQLEEELWITLKHEIGHYFGLDEDELAARGLD